MCSRNAAEVFSAAKILPNPKLKKIKEKFLCRIFDRNYGT